MVLGTLVPNDLFVDRAQVGGRVVRTGGELSQQTMPLDLERLDS